MKHYSIVSIVIAVLLSACAVELHAQHKWAWALAIQEKGTERPTIIDYHAILVTAENGVEYHRIIAHGHNPYTPIELQYGYRLADRQIFIYDFDSQKETLAFDFNLAPGDRFTTFNGMEWMVESACDTLVNISFEGKGDDVSKRLLTVRSLDGSLTDQWLEDFGSFANHFMINGMENVEWSHALWMQYDYGVYLTREISIDPFFSHDTGWLDAIYSGEPDPLETGGGAMSKCTFDNGRVVFEDVKLAWEHRYYDCFFRNGDDIYRQKSWELTPHVDGGKYALRKDSMTFTGLPTPESGKYTVHIGDNEYTTDIRKVSPLPQSSDEIYDMRGQRLGSEPTKGIYIRGGRKKIATLP